MSRNLVASIRTRLKQRADATKQDFNLTLTHYGLERLLYRLSVSALSLVASSRRRSSQPHAHVHGDPVPHPGHKRTQSSGCMAWCPRKRDRVTIANGYE